MVPDGRTEWTDGRTDDAKTISLRLRLGIIKSERSTISLTVMQLESVNTDPMGDHVCKTPEAQRLDLENAVIMQVNGNKGRNELMAIIVGINK